MKTKKSISTIIKLLRTITKNFPQPLTQNIIKKYGKNPYIILISCLLSLRAKDNVTINVCKDLFKVAKTPKAILKIPTKELEKIYGGMWDVEADPVEHARKMIAHIDKKRKELGIDKARERVLMDMASRQALEA